MAWFIAAGLLGFASYYAWQPLAGRNAASKFFALVLTLAVAFAALWVWAFCIAKANSINALLDGLGQGVAVRFLLGFALGVGAAYVTRRRSGAAEQPPQSLLEGEGRTAYLSVALAIVLLAVVAPHVDRWQSRLTSLKASGVEIQLAAISSKLNAVKPDTREFFADQAVLNYVIAFAFFAKQDYDFLFRFDLRDLQQRLAENPGDAALKTLIEHKTKQLTLLQQTRQAFEMVVSPLARCIKLAIDNGLNIDSAREKLRPLADKMTEIIIREEEFLATSPRPDPKNLQDARQSFWEDLTKIPKVISAYLKTADRDRCESISKVTIAPIPQYGEHKNLPHFFGAMSYLLMFVNNDGLALTTMQRAQSGWNFEDFRVPYLRALLMYYQGYSIDRYKGILDSMRATAQRQQAVIKRVIDRCGSGCDAELKRLSVVLTERARGADLLAINTIVYGVAQDLAAGAPSVVALEPIALELAAELKRAVDKDEHNQNKGTFLDTYAFLTLVVEARKQDRDHKKINEAINILKTLVAYEEEQLKVMALQKVPTKQDYVTLKELRAHLEAGNALLD